MFYLIFLFKTQYVFIKLVPMKFIKQGRNQKDAECFILKFKFGGSWNKIIKPASKIQKANAYDVEK